MKYKFILTMSGNDSLEKKLHTSLEQVPGLNVDIIRSIGSLLMIAFRLNESDNIGIESFVLRKVNEEPEKHPLEENKKVDN